jgi:hypothetical protein
MILFHLTKISDQLCHGLEMYKDGVDLKLTMLDIACNQESEHQDTAAIGLGESLEADKRYEDAAALYLELAEESLDRTSTWQKILERYLSNYNIRS